MKPHKWGYKFYMLCATGDENNPKYRRPEELDLGSSANIVIRLCRHVPNNQN